MIVLLVVLGLGCVLGGSVFGGVLLGACAASLGMYLVFDLSSRGGRATGE